MEVDGDLPGRPLRVLVASAFQPRVVEDALRVSFAIAGFTVDFVSLDGISALEAMLATPAEDPDMRVDMALMPMFANSIDLALPLGGRLASHLRAPVLAVVLAEDEGPSVVAPTGVELMRVVTVGPATDERFVRTFGTMPSAEAVDRLSEEAAGFAARLKGTAPKLVVTDLDGTLWSGTLGEDGVEGISLHAAYAEALKGFREQGILLALASRNDLTDVEAIFADHPDWPLQLSDFATIAVGWETKDELVARCLATLNLSSAHAVVIDDDSVNCARLAERFPEADIRLFAEDRPNRFAAMLRAEPLLKQTGGASSQRAEHYRRREAVERLREEADDVGDFLRRLGTHLTVEPLVPSLFPRAAELASRVNQFALTDFRPNSLELAARNSPFDFMVRLDDAFGAHGLVGLVLAHRRESDLVLDNLLLSCRALGRGVEDAMLAALAQLASEEGCDRLLITVAELSRNEPARRWFSAMSANANTETVALQLPAGQPKHPEAVRLTWNRRVK